MTKDSHRMSQSTWIEVDELSDFSIDNIPFGVCSFPSPAALVTDPRPRCCTIIGNTVIDLSKLSEAGLFDSIENFESPMFTFDQPTLNDFMRHPKSVWVDTRNRIIELVASTVCTTSSLAPDARLQKNLPLQRAAFHDFRSEEIKMHLPASIQDYTDFYSSREHATNVGSMFRDPQNALNPNWTRLPVGYHGRSSSIFVSGQDITRPCGQLQMDPNNPHEGSIFGPTRLLDFELEVAFFVGGKPNKHGERLTIEEASDRIFGFVLMNDWSARDIQKWEYVPLGPFGSKNFATTISPWIVTTMALERNRCPTSYEIQDPIPLEYLRDCNYSSYDVELNVAIQGKNMMAPGVVTFSNLRNVYWNARQQLVHHSVTGCILNPGDLLGSGTISGPSTKSLGCLLELSWKGTRNVELENDGSEVRKFLMDGDTVLMTGYAQKPGYGRVGFGSCIGKILPAHSCVEENDNPGVKTSENLDREGLKRFTDFKLYGFWRSSCTWRVRVALAAKTIPYKSECIDILHDKAHKKKKYCSDINTMSQVPVLECTDSLTGNRLRITQSLAIIDFLEEAFPKVGSSLLPGGTVERALVREVSEIVNSGIQPFQNLSLMDIIADVGGNDDGAMIAKIYIENGLKAIEKIVRGRKYQRGEASGPFAIGGFSPTIADACLVPQLYNARRFGADLEPMCPSLLEVEAACLDHQWFKLTHPDVVRRD